MERRLKQKLIDRQLGLFMALIGLNILLFVYSGRYWTLINPKYSLVTAAAGGICALLGLILLIHPVPLRRQALFSAGVILVLLCGLNIFVRQQALESSGSVISLDEQLTRSFSRETRGAKDYIKINIAELTTLIESDSPLIQTENFLFRGRIYPSDSVGPVVFRTAVSCCLADAISVGVRIRTSTPMEAAEGQWVNVYGRVIEETETPTTARHIDRIDGFMAVIQPGITFQADTVEKIDPPEFRMMFQFRRQEPFAY